VAGWAAAGARLAVRVDGAPAGIATANEDRPDLAVVGGQAFELWFDPPLRPGAEVTVEGFAGVCVAASRRHRWQPDSGRPLALFVDQSLPVAGRDAGAEAALSHVAALERLGFAVTVVAHGAVEAALAAHAGQVRLAYLHRLASTAWMPAVRAANPGVMVLYGVGDLHGLRARRRFAVTGHPVPEGLEAAELTAARHAVVVTHSDYEAALLAEAGVAAHVVPWAVPGGRRGMAQGDVMFLGGFGHAPNVDAAAWLLAEVMPRVWAQRPELRLRVVGRDVPGWLRDAASERVAIVPDATDLAACWAEARLAVAPLRYGAGIKGKVVSALAHGVPCVCTPIAAEGLEDAPLLLAAAEPSEYARAMVAAWDDAGRVRDDGAHRVRWAGEHWSEAATERALAAAIDAAQSGR